MATSQFVTHSSCHTVNSSKADNKAISVVIIYTPVRQHLKTVLNNSNTDGAITTSEHTKRHTQCFAVSGAASDVVDV